MSKYELVQRREQESSTSLWFLGALVGILGGLAIGLLTAPRPGRDTRGQLKDTVRVLPDRVSELVDDSLDVYATSVNYLQVIMEDQTDRIKRSVNAAKMAAAKKREELEMEGGAILPFQHR